MRVLKTLTIALLIGLFANVSDAISVMPNYYYDLSITRAPTSADGDFTIRLTSPSSVTGCMEVTAPTIKTIDAGAVLYMTLEEGTVSATQGKRYGQHDCNLNAGPSYAEVTLNKNKIEKNGTYKIDIKSKSAGRLFDIKLSTDANSVTLDSTLKMPTSNPNHTTHQIMQHWFLPDDTIIVSSQNMKRNKDIKNKVKDLAQSRGLKPLGSILNGFNNPVDKLYYVDTQKALNETLKDGNAVPIGEITTADDFRGTNGAYKAQKKQTVFAKRPSIYESSTIK